MKKIFLNAILSLPIVLLAVLSFPGCKKDDVGSSNSVVLSGPDSVSAGGVVILEGRGLAHIETIELELGHVPATFNPVLNNSGAVIFRVPDTAWGGPTNIILTNKQGNQITFPIVVVTPPIVDSASTTDYVGGMEVNLWGNNLQFVSEIALVDMSGKRTGESAEIISKSKNQLLIKMPESTAPRVNLEITNTSSTKITAQSFVNIGLARPVFLDGYAPRMENWSWGQTGFSITTSEKFFGEASLQVDFSGQAAGGAFRIWNRDMIAFDDYQEVAFWIKGADVPLKFSFSLDQKEWQNIEVAPRNWTYFHFPLSIWRNVGMTQTNSIVLKWGSAGTIIYLDNIVLIK